MSENFSLHPQRLKLSTVECGSAINLMMLEL